MGRVIAGSLYLHMTDSPDRLFPQICASPSCPEGEDPNYREEYTLNSSIVELEVKSLVTVGSLSILLQTCQRSYSRPD